MRPRAQKRLEYRLGVAPRHTRWSYPANGSRECAPDDRFRRAIQYPRAARLSQKLLGYDGVEFNGLILRSREAAFRRMGLQQSNDPSRCRLRLLLRVRQQEETRVRQSVGKAWWHSRSADAAWGAERGRRRCGDARGAPRAAGGRRF